MKKLDKYPLGAPQERQETATTITIQLFGSSVDDEDVRLSEFLDDRASSIREYYKPRDIKIRTPDAIHLATAIIYKVDEFQTLDGLRSDGTYEGGLLRFRGQEVGTNCGLSAPTLC
jgi:hypothetical protein